MISRGGGKIRVAYAAHEILWIKAALTLPTKFERWNALRQVASMSGRTYRNVLAMSEVIRREARYAEMATEATKPPPAPLAPSQIKRPSLAFLMGSRAVSSRRALMKETHKI